jgi:hypothetical protein
MKRTILVIIFLSILWGCHNRVQHNVVSEDETATASAAFTEVKDALKTDNGQLWNHPLDGPILLVDRDNRVIIANETDLSGALKKQGTVFTGWLPEQVNIANTAFDWNGKRWTMVALPLPDQKEERLNLLIHELFHRIQPAIGFDSLFEIQSTHLDSKEGRIYLKLELEALKKACLSEDPLPHLKNALLFRQYRYQLFPEARQAENSLEINEGLAEYTGAILSGRDDAALKKHFAEKIDGFYDNPTFVRSFAYYTIPVYGYFMRQTDNRWNLKINRHTNLPDFIIEFFQLTPQNLVLEDIKRIGENYGMDSIIDQETQRQLKHEALVNHYRKIFLGDSVVKISLQNMNIGFNPGNIMPLDTLGTVYPNLRITDNWGILEVDSCGALINPGWNMVTISFPIAISDTEITGRGWNLKLNSGWKLEKTDHGFRVTKN